MGSNMTRTTVRNECILNGPCEQLTNDYLTVRRLVSMSFTMGSNPILAATVQMNNTRYANHKNSESFAVKRGKQ